MPRRRIGENSVEMAGDHVPTEFTRIRPRVPFVAARGKSRTSAMSIESTSKTDLDLGMMNARAYPHAVNGIRRIETHISVIFLVGEFAYKIKKPLQTPFLDYSSLEDRRRSCEAEVALNQRYAQELYLGVVPITRGLDGAVAVDGPGQALEYAVKMRRFPDGALLSEQLQQGKLMREHVDSLAVAVARFHQNAQTVETGSVFGLADLVWAQAEDNFKYFEEHPKYSDSEIVGELRKWSAATFTKLASAFERRRYAGYVRACHGDLHLANIILWNGDVKPFDGIEFNEALRWIDVLSDAAFVVMDFYERGHEEFGNRFLNAYLERTGDYEDLSVLRWYTVYRAMVRAKVAAMRASQSCAEVDRGDERSWRELHAYLDLAARLARPADKRRLFITHGVSGSGKTVGTQARVEREAAIRVRSDVERKRLFHDSLYSETTTRAVYGRLLTLARAILLSGWSVVVDATFLKRQQRDAMRALAIELGSDFTILHFDASLDVLTKRLRERKTMGKDASDADETVLQMQLAGMEQLGDDEQGFVDSTS